MHELDFDDIVQARYFYARCSAALNCNSIANQSRANAASATTA
jgi:hypothetical protein